jgi:uncharacterized membrane protein
MDVVAWVLRVMVALVALVALVTLPAADVLNRLAYTAAAGIAIVLIGATVLHLRRLSRPAQSSLWYISYTRKC